jgi:hypothetical protein
MQMAVPGVGPDAVFATRFCPYTISRLLPLSRDSRSSQTKDIRRAALAELPQVLAKASL